MCTLVLLRRPGHPWPLLLAGNRDEMEDRPTAPPGRHWEDRPEVTAGLDHLAGGSWMGLNDHGLVAVVMNREGSLGPAAGKRSRGELVLEALDHAEARDAADALVDLAPGAYRPFNLVVADPREAFWLSHRNAGSAVRVQPIAEGLHMLTARDLDDAEDPRIRAYLPRFRTAPPPAPDAGDWTHWQGLLASHGFEPTDGPRAAMCLTLDGGFATLSGALIALPAHPGFGGQRPVWLYADGPPDRAPFLAVDLG